MANPFYSDGLHFSCTQCSACCRHDPGYVFLSESDYKALSTKTNLTYREFYNRYCTEVNIGGFLRISLTEKKNYDCIFWEGTGCSVYDARPFQCRSYPFWSTWMESRETWDSLEADCPGVNKGQLHSAEEIDSWLADRRNESYLTPELLFAMFDEQEKKD